MVTGPDHQGIHALLVAVSFVFTTIYLLVVPKARGIKDALAAFIIGIPTGWLVGFVVYDYYDTVSIALLVSSVSTLVARSLILGIIHGGDSMRGKAGEWADRAVKNIIDKVTK